MITMRSQSMKEIAFLTSQSSVKAGWKEQTQKPESLECFLATTFRQYDAPSFPKLLGPSMYFMQYKTTFQIYSVQHFTHPPPPYTQTLQHKITVKFIFLYLFKVLYFLTKLSLFKQNFKTSLLIVESNMFWKGPREILR